MLPRTLELGGASQQLFDVALVILESLDYMQRDNLELQTYAQEWIQLLLAHETTEVRRVSPY